MNVINEVFTKVILLSLEDWGMMLAEPTETSPALFSDCDELLIGSMTFRGVTAGSISILCAKPFTEILCRNVLGMASEEEITTEQCEDALKELTNILSGNFLTEAYGDDTVFELVYPYVEKVNDQVLNTFFTARLVACYLADDEPVAIALGSAKGVNHAN